MAEGFFEWKKDGAKKQPYYVHLKDGRPMLFAALFDCWQDDEGQPLYTYTILTTPASKRLEWLHDRMPAILKDSDALDTWLGSSEDTKKCISPYNEQDLVWYAVTPNMGKMSFDGPECIAEVKPTSAGSSAIAKLFGKKTSAVSPKAAARPLDESTCVDEGGPMTEEERKAFDAALFPDELDHSAVDDYKGSQDSPVYGLRSTDPEGKETKDMNTPRENVKAACSPKDELCSPTLPEETAPKLSALQEGRNVYGSSMEGLSCITQAEGSESKGEPAGNVKEEDFENSGGVFLGQKRKLDNVSPGKASEGPEWKGEETWTSPKKMHKEWKGDDRSLPPQQGPMHGPRGGSHGKHGGRGVGMDKKIKDDARGKQKTLLSFFGK
eukprot:TRINITY_DN22917_c0_g1_i1.p1 TRINITY_DN22917_c0_g1~~TRINITY_DN22917_c0_g1_i1.p1  ORF type:complete len:431 (-),score=105.40 TRINITY_DN22917_c0_g1_i1:93-1235(-)